MTTCIPRQGGKVKVDRTSTQQDDLVVQGQLREVRDPLGPLHQREQLLVCRLADVRHWVLLLTVTIYFNCLLKLLSLSFQFSNTVNKD